MTDTFMRADSQPVTISQSWHGQVTELGRDVREAFDRLWQGASPVENIAITRSEFADVLADVSNPRAAIALIIAWGAGPSAWYWPASVRKNYSQWNPDVAESVMSGNDDPFEAFASLWQPGNTKDSALPGVGTSFGTKILYWARRRLDREVRPLIYDARVHRALHGLSARWQEDGKDQEFDHPWTCVRFAGYAAYCALLAGVAQQANHAVPVRADDVEVTLFEASTHFAEAPKRSGCGGSRGRDGGPEYETNEERTPTVTSNLRRMLSSFDWRVPSLP